MIISAEAKQRVIEWLKTPRIYRNPTNREGLAKELGISVSTISTYAQTLRKEGSLPVLAKSDKKFNALSKQLMEFTPEEILEYKRHVYDTAMEKDSSAKDKELFAKIQGLIVDKSDVKVKFELSADELARIEQQARERNIGEGLAVGEGTLPRQLPVFSPKIRQDK